jgi:hypothetical protein
MKTIKELAIEALQIQDASNLSGCVHSFSRAMTDLWKIANAEGWASTEKINTHPIAIMYSSKISSLTNSEEVLVFSHAYDAVTNLANQ